MAERRARDLADQIVRTGFGHLDIHKSARFGGTRSVNETVNLGCISFASTGDPAITNLFHQYLNRLVNKTLVSSQTNRSLRAHQAVVPFAFDSRGDLIRHIVARGSRFPAECKRPNPVKPGFADKIHQMAELGFSFARKPHDKRGADRDFGHYRSNLAEQF